MPRPLCPSSFHSKIVFFRFPFILGVFEIFFLFLLFFRSVRLFHLQLSLLPRYIERGLYRTLAISNKFFSPLILISFHFSLREGSRDRSRCRVGKMSTIGTMGQHVSRMTWVVTCRLATITVVLWYPRIYRAYLTGCLR